jgi:hypothetical protein
MEVAFQYNKKRSQFGHHTTFDDVPAAILESVGQRYVVISFFPTSLLSSGSKKKACYGLVNNRYHVFLIRPLAILNDEYAATYPKNLI